MMEVANGTLFLNNAAGREGFYNHAEVIDGDHIIENAVVAGSVTFTGEIIVIGTLVVV
jgi:hypothetical protein|tara:strand:- start:53 stop:226 length:174 start_codon:yes stop_codon:yes gene_type:complete